MTGMAYTTIRLERDGRGLAQIVLDRPERRNAFNDTMLAELDACVRTLNDDPAVKAVAVRGAGEHFSAGRDTAELAGVAGRDSGRPVPAAGGHESSMFRALEMPVVALLDGAVVGGSLGFALQCDLRIATTRARLFDGHLPHGMAPSVSIWYLPRLVGTGRALQFATRTAPLPAAEALALGLVDEVVEPAGLDAALERCVAGFLAGDGALVRHTKLLLRHAQESSYHDAMQQVGLVRALERAGRGGAR
jgi:enoyl-CoA hydratase/carnithine racemase